MAFFNENIREELSALIGELKDHVNIYAFKSDSACITCKDTMQYLSEIAELNTKINLKVFDKDNDADIFKKFNILRVPAIIIIQNDTGNTGVRFYGIPSGYEVHSLISSIKEASGIKSHINESFLLRIKKIDYPVHIQVFVTPTCPYCPQAVINGHTLAFYNTNIVCDMIESGSFAELAQGYNIQGVPKIIINEKLQMEGSQPLEKLLEEIENI